MRDGFGMPVPDKSSPLPWKQFDAYEIVDANCDEVVCVVRKAFVTNADCKFSVHAANWIIPCREIVLRLAEWSEGEGFWDDWEGIATDAAKLWNKMQEDAKGGGGETSL